MCGSIVDACDLQPLTEAAFHNPLYLFIHHSSTVHLNPFDFNAPQRHPYGYWVEWQAITACTSHRLSFPPMWVLLWCFKRDFMQGSVSLLWIERHLSRTQLDKLVSHLRIYREIGIMRWKTETGLRSHTLFYIFISKG